MFKSLISLILSDFIFPIVIVSSWFFCIYIFPSYGVLIGAISVIFWIVIFTKYTSKFDKYK